MQRQSLQSLLLLRLPKANPVPRFHFLQLPLLK